MTIRSVVLAALGLAADAADLPSSRAALLIDGKLDDALWTSSGAQALAPGEAGVPADLGGDVRVALRGSWLCLAARLPEPGGKVLARSFGRNPEWDRDQVGSPEVEDRVVFTHALFRRVAAQPDRSALRLIPGEHTGSKRTVKSYRHLDVLRSAQVTIERVELRSGIPLISWTSDATGDAHRGARSASARAGLWRRSSGGPGLRLRTVRIHPRRRPEHCPPPECSPPALGNTDPALEIGRVLKAPPMVANWDDPAWQNSPAFSNCHEMSQSAGVRVIQRRSSGCTTGGRSHCCSGIEEPEPVVARAGGRDSDVTGDDHVAMYLATSGSRFLEIAVNSVGAIRDRSVIGPHHQRPQDRLERQDRNTNRHPARALDRTDQYSAG